MHKRLISAFLLQAAASTPLAAEAKYEVSSNPIIRDTFTADPAPLVARGRVYLYVGHDASADTNYNMPDWLLYSTSDLKTWTKHGVVLKPTDFKWAKRDAYAAQVTEKNGKYYFYATAAHDSSHPGMAIGVAVADNPEGHFVDARGSALITNEMTPQGKHGWSDIDPTVYTDRDGVSWIAWGNGNCFIARLKPNMIELDGPIAEVKLPYYEEGPWLYRRGDLYYLAYASWNHDRDKAERISYATATSVKGPWTYRGEITGEAKNSSTIHTGIIEFKGEWYFFYHDGGWSIDGRQGSGSRRAVRVEKLLYNADGTIQPLGQTDAGIYEKRLYHLSGK